MLWMKVVNVGKAAGQDDKEVCAYRYLVGVNDRVIAEGNIPLHVRKDGWNALVAKVLENEKGPGY